jgi:hypothetical protein
MDALCASSEKFKGKKKKRLKKEKDLGAHVSLLKSRGDTTRLTTIAYADSAWRIARFVESNSLSLSCSPTSLTTARPRDGRIVRLD